MRFAWHGCIRATQLAVSERLGWRHDVRPVHYFEYAIFKA